MLKEVWEELKASLVISYPNFEGVGEWEPARSIFFDDYNWDNLNTGQIDVIKM